MQEDEQIRLLETSLDRQFHWISGADVKAGFAFTLDTAMLGLLAAIAPRTTANWAIAPAIFTAFAVFFELVALAFLAVASFPRTGGPRGSLIFCGGIAQKTVEQFRDAMKGLSATAYIEDLASQVYRNAEIAARKFTWIQRALSCLFISVVPWGIALWLLYDKNP